MLTTNNIINILRVSLGLITTKVITHVPVQEVAIDQVQDQDENPDDAEVVAEVQVIRVHDVVADHLHDHIHVREEARVHDQKVKNNEDNEVVQM